jgi:catechol 2,3-dioxygenase-like lactoylglutathione lyase family enzyme
VLLGIDHLVIVVRDLEQAARDYEALGFTVVPGGRHPVGTHNALIALADGSYIELIAFYRESPDHRWWDALWKGEGLVDFCMRTDDMPGDAQALRDAGVDIGEPQPWSRTRPDGYQLRWQLSIPRGEHRGVAPFLIQDETPREERVPRETRHENGVTGIGTVVVAVRDLGEAQYWYRALFRRHGRAVARDDLKASGAAFSVRQHTLQLLEPDTPESPLSAWLEWRGPSPYAATLKTSGERRGQLEPRLTHGANLYLE